jgi:2-methylaconitate cis-trans-isomerase PrpF
VHELSALEGKMRRSLTPPRTPRTSRRQGRDNSVSGFAQVTERQVEIRHGGGIIYVVVKISRAGHRDGEGDLTVDQITVSRTARRLLEGCMLFSL